LTGTLWQRFSLRTQMLLIFVGCLGLAGISTVFLNAYLIASLTESMRRQALNLTLDVGERASREIAALLEEDGTERLAEIQHNPKLGRQLDIILGIDKKVLLVRVDDANGVTVFAEGGIDPDVVELRTHDESFEENVRGGDFDHVREQLRKSHPKVRIEEIPIRSKNGLLGHLRFLISESPIYADIEAASAEVTRLLWSVLLAFVGVLTLALYLMTRLFRRHVSLLGENQRLDRMAYLGTLASGLAHEIRNPLNAMAVNLTVADEEIREGGEDSPEIVRRALGMIQREVARLSRSVTSFMEFAHPEVNRQERTELSPLLSEVLELVRPQIEESGAEVEVDLPENAAVMADFSGLRQVLYNVILNGLQAMMSSRNGDRPRRLIIGGRRESAQWFLWIEDTGPGLPAGGEERIFEVFHTTKAGGSGFGLAIARGIIEAHDGDIRARPAESGGTRFEITLPETGQKGKGLRNR